MGRDSKHTTAQRKGKERDWHTCQVCGSRDHTEGHHIIEYQYGGGSDVSNIVALFHNCHQQVHNGKINVIKF